MHEKVLNALNHDPWLLTLPASARQELIAAISLKRIRANHALFKKGDNDGHLYGVVSGRIRLGATTYSGNELMFTSVVAGDWFGEISILDGLGRTHDAVAVEESELAVVPKESIAKLCRQNTYVHQAIVQLLCNHCRQAFEAIDDFLLLNPEQRLATRLLRINKSLAPLSAIKINQQELSSLVGISRQSINKILKKWEREDWISLAYSSIIINDEDRLSTLVEKC